MKQKLIYWLPLLLLVGCSQPTYKTTSLAPEKRAELLLKTDFGRKGSVDDGQLPGSGASGHQTL